MSALRAHEEALRRTLASALISAGLDARVISRRLGHAKSNIPLDIYGRLFKKNDSAAASASEATLRTRSER